MRQHVIKVGPHSIVGYKVNNNRELSDFQKLTLIQNCSKAHTVGQITENQQKQIKTMLQIWLSSIYIERDISGMSVKEFPYYPSFLTITLPKDQRHDDQWIKKHMFFRLLEILQKKYGVHHYFWRAEKKHGKRIHFHIITDRYLKWQDVRIEWNLICRNNYYHEDIPINYESLGSNSIDIEKITNFDGACKYVSKYMSKDEHNDRIGGHVWGCSRGLKNINQPVFVCDDIIMNDLSKLRNESGVTHTNTEQYEVVLLPKGKKIFDYKYCFSNLYTMFCMDAYRELYLSNESTINYEMDCKDLHDAIRESTVIQAELWV